MTPIEDKLEAMLDFAKKAGSPPVVHRILVEYAKDIASEDRQWVQAVKPAGKRNRVGGNDV